MTMIEIIYVSRAGFQIDSQQIKKLLSVSRRNNQRSNITGLLLYDGVGTFIQALEGDEEDVIKLYDKIKTDNRHSRVNMLWKKTVTSRRFPDWKMGFRQINDLNPRDLQGYADFFEKAESSEYFLKKQGFIVEMFNHFKSK